MPAGRADRGNRFLSQLVRQLSQLVGLQAAQIGGRFDRVEQGRFGGISHPTGIAAPNQYVDYRN
jgi:hypothetical protein